MTRRRWFADEFYGDRAAITEGHADHLIRVLRARVGEEFDIVAGPVLRRGRITEVSPGRVEFQLGEEISPTLLDNPPAVTVFLSIFKFDRMEWAIEKCAELGVARIVPVIAQRTDAHLASAAAKRCERWRRIALQAAEQSRRAEPMKILDPVKFLEAVGCAGSLRIALSESEREMKLRDVLGTRSQVQAEDVELAVGPEGGWREDEIESFHRFGWISASLGNTILRTETAAIAAVAIVFSELS